MTGPEIKPQGVDNPPAFPSHAGDPNMSDPRNRISCGGMTLRDWFAGQALAGLRGGLSGGYVPDSAECEEAATVAFRIADAMLAARGAQ